MPLFLALRALIRAHVTATMAEHGWGGEDRDAAFAEARAYLDEAEAALAPSPPRLVAIGGLSGTGKSTLAAGNRAGLGRPPGARVLRSDVMRKLLFGTDAGKPAAARGLCARNHRARVPGSLRRRRRGAARRLCGGDRRRRAARGRAACLCRGRGRSRRAVHRAVARRAGGQADGAGPGAKRRRLRRIAGRSSRSSSTHDPGVLDWTRIDAGAGPDATLAAARRALFH